MPLVVIAAALTVVPALAAGAWLVLAPNGAGPSVALRSDGTGRVTTIVTTGARPGPAERPWQRGSRPKRGLPRRATSTTANHAWMRSTTGRGGDGGAPVVLTRYPRAAAASAELNSGLSAGGDPHPPAPRGNLARSW